MTATTCPSKHWSLPAPCMLAAGHREIWHEAHFANGRIRFRRVGGVYATEILRNGEWRKLLIAPPETPETEVERLQSRIAELEAAARDSKLRIAELVGDLKAAKAERDIEVIAWLHKKARECEGNHNRVESKADLIDRLADKIARGAVRPTNTAVLK